MTRVIDYRDLGRVIGLSAKGIDRAAARTLNSVAFNSLPKLVSQAEGDMKFSSNARRALGWRVDKAKSGNLEAAVWTNRGWFHFHADQGNRSAESGGMVYKGERWLFIPRQKGASVVDKRGRIRKGAYSNVFLAPRGDHALVLYRPKRAKDKDVELIGIAVKQAKFKRDTDWQAEIEAEWRNSATTILRRELDKQRQWG